MDAKVSTKTKTKTFQNLNKNCPLISESFSLCLTSPKKNSEINPLLSKFQINWDISSKFCGLLKKREL